MLGVRIIVKKSDCVKCKTYIERLSHDNTKDFEFETMDVDAPDLQKQMDEWMVDEVPVVQIYDKETDKIRYQFPPGTFSKSVIKDKIKLLQKA